MQISIFSQTNVVLEDGIDNKESVQQLGKLDNTFNQYDWMYYSRDDVKQFKNGREESVFVGIIPKQQWGDLNR
ncbi:MAG: hypothetical protein ACJAZP_002665 [Psychromonas sp.]